MSTPLAVVVIPWWLVQEVDPQRVRALAWLHAQLAERAPWARVVVGSVPEDQVWCKAAAVMPEVALAPTGSVVVVLDADVWVNAEALRAAVEAVADGAPWARPHCRVLRLNAAATRAWLAGRTEISEGIDLDRRPYMGEDGGGAVVATRERLLECPYDKRFQGWGQEDSALGAALHVVQGGAWRGRADLVHLYHRPAPRLTPRKGSEANWQLWVRYSRARARNDPAAMRTLLAEAWP